MTFFGRTIITVCVTTNYILTTELYPTVIRSRGLGFGSICGRIGGLLGPQILKLSIVHFMIPGTLVASLSLLAAFLSFTLPETNGRGLLQSIEETEEFYENCKLKKSENIVK